MMISTDTLLNAYIDANVVLALGAVVWIIARFVMHRTALKAAHGMQLQLLYGFLIVVAVVPFAALMLWPQMQSFNLSDLIVAEYLDGRIAIAPTTFEAWLQTRATLVREITTLGSARGMVIAVVLLTGIALASLRMIINLTRVYRVIGQSYLWRRAGRLEIRLTDAASIPFSTRSLRKHYVVIPSEMLATPADLRIALAHEFQHLRQRDVSWEIVLECLRPLVVFNPAMRFFKRQVERQRELACDQGVMRRKALNAQDYANCLLRVCANSLKRQGHTALPAVALLQPRGRRNASFLRQRVLMMMAAEAAPTPRWIVPMILCPLSCAILLSTIAIQRSGDWSHDRLMLSTIVNLERFSIRNTSP